MAKTQLDETHDVVIVGFGPVGAVLALLLGKSGLRVAIADQSPDIFDKPRAIGADHEFMRAMQFCGVGDKLATHILAFPGSQYRGLDDQLIGVFEPTQPPYPLGWPPVVLFVQPELERLLREEVNSHENIDVFLGWKLVSVDDRQGEVTLISTVKEVEQRHRTLRARYILACDGAASTVRKLLNIALEDLDFDQRWLVVDAWLEKPADLPVTNVHYCHPSRPTSFIIGPGKLRRWEVRLRPNESPTSFETADGVLGILSRYVGPDAIKLWRTAVYQFHALVARQWRKRTVFLVGDAAHQSPPFLGQGLCAGVRDAVNLAWKIIHVEAGRADAALLDSYELERRPHTKAVIEESKKAGLIIGETDEGAARRRDEAMQAAMRAGTDTRYRHRLIPPLNSGIIHYANMVPTASAGHLSVQPMITIKNRQLKLDDYVGLDFLLLTRAPGPQRWINSELEQAWERLGGRRLVIANANDADDAGTGELFEVVREVGDVFERWMAELACEAVIVRPDRYIFGIATTAGELNGQLVSLVKQMDPSFRFTGMMSS